MLLIVVRRADRLHLYDEAGGRSFVEATEPHQAAKREAKEAREASEITPIRL